jgi:integrase/recombinase XerD
MEDMSAVAATIFDKNYELHQKHLKLKGLQPKTIEAYSRAIRRVGDDFNHQIDHLTEADLLDYFTDLGETHSWSSIKLDLYGLKFYHQYVLKKPWVTPGLVQPPRSQRLPDIVTVEEADRIFMATRVLSYRVFFFALDSLGLRLGEGLRLTVADIDGARERVHIRDAKGNKDRLGPLPMATYRLLRRFWQRHRNPVRRFPNRHGGLAGARAAKTPLDRGGVQNALRAVVESCGLKKNISPHSLRHAYATPLIEAGVDLLEVQRNLGHHSILTTARYTHLTDQTKHHAIDRINALMDRFTLAQEAPRGSASLPSLPNSKATSWRNFVTG